MPDLMAALEASIAGAKRPEQAEAEASKPKAAPPRRRQPLRASSWPARVEVEVEGRQALALEPRQGPLPRGRVHQGPGHRLLHARRAGPAAAPARPPADAQALPQRRRRRVLLREAVPVAPPDWVQTAPIARSQQDDRLLRLRRPADAGLAGQPRRPRAAPVAVAGRRDPAPDDDGVRPRPRAAPAALVECCEVALLLRDALDAARAWRASRRRRARRACRCTCR